MSYKLRVLNITITTAGIPEVGPDLQTKKVQILAPATNSGALYYGSEGLTAGIYRVLAAGASDPHDAPDGGEIDLSALRFDAATSGDKVTLIYYEWQPSPDPAYVTPKEVSGLLGWWKADAITGLSDGAAISSWTDSSGNSKTLTGIGSARPLYKTNVRNGLPGVLFDGVNDTFEVGLTYGVCTLLWVSHLTTGGRFWWGDSGDEITDYIQGGPDESMVGAERGNKGFYWTYASNWLDGAGYFTVRMAALNADSRVRRAGAEVISTGSEGGPRDTGTESAVRNVFVGTRDGDFPIAGHLFEMMIFNSALPMPTIALLEAYLKQKWSLD